MMFFLNYCVDKDKEFINKFYKDNDYFWKMFEVLNSWLCEIIKERDLLIFIVKILFKDFYFNFK